MPKYTIDGRIREQIVNLRQTGAGWMEIERRTGIARRTAQRVFNEWQDRRHSEEKSLARREVASREFERHIRDLVAMANAIGDVFELPSPRDRQGADDVLTRLLERDVRSGDMEVSGSLTSVDGGRVRRRNRLLLEALREHTKSRVDWEQFDLWLKARKDWAEARVDLEKRLHDGLLASTGEKPKCARWLESEQLKEGVVAGLVVAVISGLTDAPSDAGAGYLQVKVDESNSHLLFGYGSDMVAVALLEREAADAIMESCRALLVSLHAEGKCDELKRLKHAYEEMSSAKQRLLDELEELRLIPLILATRCDYCPA